jgi:hypothetical protein
LEIFRVWSHAVGSQVLNAICMAAVTMGSSGRHAKAFQRPFAHLVVAAVNVDIIVFIRRGGQPDRLARRQIAR